MSKSFFGLPINGLDNFEAERAPWNWNGFPVPLVEHDFAVQIAEAVGEPAPAPYEGVQPYSGLCWSVGTGILDVRADIKDALTMAGLDVSWEYPGWLGIVSDEGLWAFGTDNGFWQGDLMTGDGEVLRSVALDIHGDSGDVAAIVLAIGRTLLTRTCPDCGGTMSKEHEAINEQVISGYGETGRATRPATFYACSECEYCKEVTRG